MSRTGTDSDAVGLRVPVGVFASAVFLGAFLIFQVQPLISKAILPWYGGTPAVWTTCLLVFQTLLFAGYAYAHWSIGHLRPRTQVWLHAALLLAAAAAPVLPGESWKPAGDGQPLIGIIVLLGATVGLPYFVLSATGPLLQAWFWRAHPGRSPYPLYALSNAGSLIALLGYPFVVEPALTLGVQAAVWRWGFVGCAALCALSGWGMSRVNPVEQPRQAAAEATPALTRWVWLAWACCSVILFMAVTNQLSLNVASVPFLWVLPLSIYLLTFIVAFAGERFYSRRLLGAALVPALALVALALQGQVNYAEAGWLRSLSITHQIVIYSVALFTMNMICHGELYRLRPEPKRLTSFYLHIALGGALGGVVVGVVAPVAFLLYQELQLGILGCCLLLLLAVLRERRATATGSRPLSSTLPLVAGLLGLVLLAVVFGRQSASLLDGVIRVERNFFGLLRVEEVGAGNPGRHALELHDGAVTHGVQFVHQDLRARPTTYFTEWSGIGRLMRETEDRDARSIAVVGLGAGTLASYGRVGDVMRFYEINPAVIDVARETFTFLEDSAAEIEVILGDARLSLEAEPASAFDILVLDAFASDAVPVHLLTAEAMDLYESRLADDGVLAVHVSNLHLDLSALVHRLVDERSLRPIQVLSKQRLDRASLLSQWILLTRDAEMERRLIASLGPMVDAGDAMVFRRKAEDYSALRPWTDDYSNLFQLIR